MAQAKPIACKPKTLLALITLPISMVFGQENISPPISTFPERLEFTSFQPCRGSASFCAPQILARGVIDEDAATRLEKALIHLPYHRTVVFDSPGGNIKAGLAMGMMIRERGLNTRVAVEYQEEVVAQDGFSTEVRTLVSDARCLSACAYAFMGGISRTLEEDGIIGVHQFYGAIENGEAAAQTLTAIISHYILSMGVDREIQDLAGLTQSTDMSVISRADAQRYNLDNQQPPLAPWELRALENGETVLRVEQQQSGNDRTTRIVLAKYQGRADTLLAAVGYGPVNELGGSNIGEILETLESKPSFCADYQDCVKLKPLRSWSYEPNTKIISGLFLIDLHLFAKLVSETGTIKFDSDFPNVYSQYAADVDLGRVGLKNGTLVIIK